MFNMPKNKIQKRNSKAVLAHSFNRKRPFMLNPKHTRQNQQLRKPMISNSNIILQQPIQRQPNSLHYEFDEEQQEKLKEFRTKLAEAENKQQKLKQEKFERNKKKDERLFYWKAISEEESVFLKKKKMRKNNKII